MKKALLQGNLTFKGFIQMYSLQTSSEEEETWKDLRQGFEHVLVNFDADPPSSCLFVGRMGTTK